MHTMSVSRMVNADEKAQNQTSGQGLWTKSHCGTKRFLCYHSANVIREIPSIYSFVRAAKRAERH